MDLVITVCDSAAGESCPLWRGTPLKIHWGFADPSHVEGSDEAKRAAFAETFGLIKHKIEKLVALPVETLDRGTLLVMLDQIGMDLA
jgi:arsenate reductase